MKKEKKEVLTTNTSSSSKQPKKSMFKTQNFRHGSYSVLLSAVVIIIALIINLAANQIPSKYSQIDISSSQLYSIGEQTSDIVSNLDTEINIYLLYQSDNQSSYAATTLMTLLSRYTDLSEHIKVSFIDPVINPTFSTQYSSDSSTLSEGSVIVESDKRYKVISSDDIYKVDYSNYSSTGTTSQNFDGENQITSAIDYVTSDNLPIVYNVTGHNEVALSASVTSSISQENMEYKELNLLSEGSIPEDCNALIINGPTSDFSSDEADMVIAYLEAGGSAFITTSYTEEELTEFNRILADYGISTAEGIVLEGDSNAYYQTPLYLLPTVGDFDITSPIVEAGTPALIIQAKGLQKSETRSTVQITDLLTTSDSAFSQKTTNGQLTGEKADGDIAGPFSLGVAVTEQVNDNNTTHLVVISSSSLLDDSITQSYNVCNSDIFLNSMGWMCEHESSISIHSKALSDETLTATALQANICTIVFIIVIPLALILIGFMIWLIRRKK